MLFNEANLVGANFTGAHLKKSNFTSAKLGESLLNRSDLTGVWFEYAKVDSNWIEHLQTISVTSADIIQKQYGIHQVDSFDGWIVHRSSN